MTFQTGAETQQASLAAASAVNGYFSIRVEDDMFGLPVTSVQTIFKIGAVTAVPGSSPDIIGLVNLRGKIVTAVSLRRRLGLPSEGSGAGCLAIGIEHKNEYFALLVDEVGDLLTLDETTRIAAPPHVAGRRAKFATGYNRLGSKILPILNVEAVFDFGTEKRLAG